MKKLLNRLRKINHLFAKCTVAWCIFWGTACCVYALRGYFNTGLDATKLLGVILGFLGGELILLIARTITSEKTSATATEAEKENKRDF